VAPGAAEEEASDGGDDGIGAVLPAIAGVACCGCWAGCSGGVGDREGEGEEDGCPSIFHGGRRRTEGEPRTRGWVNAAVYGVCAVCCLSDSAAVVIPVLSCPVLPTGRFLQRPSIADPTQTT
jgi:hypothetical protein